MKRSPIKKSIACFAIVVFLYLTNGYAQVEKGVTSTGKEVDCSTIDPSVDKTVSEYGKIVTHPRVTRNGKLITTECPTCGVDVSITDTVNCVSITLNAAITDGDPTSAVLKVYSDAAHTTQVGSNIAATISGGKISAVAANLNCHTRYYFLLEITEGTETCTFDWTDSTRDMSFENLTTCTVGSVRALGIGTDLSHEHGYNGSTTEIDSVYDHQGNAYAVVQIGEQCWLKENMRATTRPSGTNILQVPFSDKSLSSPRAYYYENDINNYYKYGCLYNFPAAMDIDDLSKSFPYPHRGICPEGWHVPSDEDWTTLATNAGVGVTTGTGAGKLAGGCDWVASPNSTAPGNYSYSDRNATSFYALPAAGCRDGVFNSLTAYANFWSTLVENVTNQVYYRDISYEHQYMGRLFNPRSYAYSVRCLRDLPLIPEFSLCEDTTFGNITLNNVKNAEKIEFIQNGTVVKTVNNPATEIIVSDLAEGSYKIKATSSTEDTLVDNARVKHTYTHCTVGALRANEMGATTTRLDSVKDHQNNWYEVVQIGNQCWLKENMRATTTPSGTNILLGGLGQFVQNNHSKAAFNHSNSVYGIMYNWCAAVDTFNNSGSKPEVATGTETGSWTCNLPAGNRRGICPEGWHIPVDGEFWELEKNTLAGLSPADSATKNYGTARSGIGAGRLAAGCEWYPDTKTTSPGNYSYAERNLSGFSARPAGTIEDGSQYANLTLAAYFWSSTPYLNTGAFARVVRTNNECTQRGSNHRYNAFSVRCIRDEEPSLSAVVDSVSCTSMMVSAEVTGLGTITGKTVCAYTNAAMTGSSVCAAPADIHVSGSTITATIKGLDDHTRYYVKVTATDGTYSVEDACTDSTRDMTMEKVTTCTVASVSLYEHANNGSTTEIDSVYDHQGNAYAVVQIGDQCWLRQNMRCTTSPRQSSVNLTQGGATNDLDFLNAKYYDRTDASMYTINERGYLYNWAAAMDTTFSNSSQLPKNTDFPNHRGICPSGWHLPTVTEWNTMAKEYLTGNDGITPISDAALTADNTYDPVLGIPNPRGKGSGKLTASCGWIEDNEHQTAPGNYSYPDRNISGFSALPIGCMGVEDGVHEEFYYLGESSDFWTATSYDQYSTWARFMLNNTEGIHHNNLNGNKNYGFAVRCVRDEEITPTIGFCEDNFYGEIKLTEVENAVRVEVLNSSDVVVNTINNPVSGVVLTGLASDTYKVRAISSSGIYTTETANLVKEYTHCTVTSLRENEMGATTTQLDSVKDHQNNWYEVVEIDGKCWLRENMRCTTSPNGRLNVAPSNYWGPNNYYTAPGTAPVYKYGYLYNWSGALDVQETNPASISSLPQNTRGICPEGWHIPVIDEWTALRSALVGESTSEAPYSGNTAYAVNTQIATILADGCDWLSDASANNKPGDYGNSNRNSSKFNWRPSPNYYGSNGTASCNTEGRSGYFWSSSPNPANPGYAYMVYLHYTQTGFISGPDNKSHGRNVRCVRDVIIPEMSVCEDTTFGTVTLREVNNAEKIEFIQNGTVKKTFNDPTEEIFVNDLAEGNYKVKATSSTGDTLVDNAYIKHTYTHCTVGALRANEMGATTTQLDSVRDHQNNWYEVVQIGNQCWLKENMRCTTSPSTGSKIMMNKIFSYSSKSAAWYDNDSTKYSQYGVLYNWCAAVDTFYAANGEPELVNHVDTIYWSCDLSTPRRGVCPEGWHVPTDDEWHVLELNVITDYDTHIDPYVGAFNGKRAGRLAVGCDWVPEGALTTAPGNYSYTERNLSGFSARPAGVYYQGFADFGWSAMFWSATNPTDMEAYSRTLFSDLEGVRRQSNGRQDGFSVRCVRDNE